MLKDNEVVGAFNIYRQEVRPFTGKQIDDELYESLESALLMADAGVPVEPVWGAARAVTPVVLWNPVDLGYAAVYVMRAVVDGTFKPGDTEVSAGRLGMLKVVNGSEVLLGPAFVFNKENIGGFDF